MHGLGNRMKMRLACEVEVDGRRHSGLVLNVSPGGLFVQTNAKPTSGDRIHVALSVPGQPANLALDAAVVWKRVVPASLLTVAQGGVGLRLLNPPEDYYQFLADTTESRLPGSTRGSALPKASAPSPRAAGVPDSPVPASEEACAGKLVYRVRVILGQRSRTITVAASCESEAHAMALSKAGEGAWRVVGSERERRGAATRN